jgi:mannose-6-phosphate isomerase
MPGPDGGFPLLIKLLDARENLSVQLHPSAEYAQAHPGAALKTEAWIILAAQPGAKVYVGLDDAVDAARFREAIETGAFLDILQTAEVSPGDAIFLESGLCHALGEGLLVAEVQTPSDTTFRTWDWNRNDPARPLHIEPACASVRLGAAQKTTWPRITRGSEATTLTTDALRTRRLIRCDYFEIDQLDVPERSGPNATMSFEQPSAGLPLVVLCTGGSGTIESGGETLELFTGRSVLIPASCDVSNITLHVRDNEKPSLLRVRPADVLDNSLA